MNSIVLAVNVVLPMAIMMGVGWIMRLTGVSDRDTMKKVDSMIFKVFMSVLMFYNVYNADLTQLRQAGYIVYGAVGLLLLFLVAVTVVPRLIHPAATAASFGQAMFRANYMLFGVAVAQNIYGVGNVGVVMLMGAVAIPLFNILATIVLEYGRSDKTKPAKMIKSVLVNPNIVAAILGILVNLSGIQLPQIILKVMSDLGGLASPLSFLSLGVSLNLASVKRSRGLLSLGLSLRLVIIPMILLIPAIFLGFRGQQLCALMVLFASPVGVSSYPMAVAMRADGELAGQLVALSTVASLGTIFCWTAALSSFALL